jgi:hypothetical protein
MMSKQTAIILILVVFLGSLGALIWLYFSFNALPQVNTETNNAVYNPFDVTPFENTPDSTSSEPLTPTQEGTTTIGRLNQITDSLVSGYLVFENTKTQKTNVNYILRFNGHIYETYTDSPETKRLSGTTVPRVYESLWLPNGENLIIRYLKQDLESVETFSVKINPATTTSNEFVGGIEGNYLPENVTALASNPLGDKLFYLTTNLTGSTGYTSKLDGLNKKSIFESPLSEWNISWPKESTITLTTKPSANVPGYLYFLNSQTGVFSRILGNINGLTTKTNKETTEVLYSDSTGTSPKLYLYIIKNNESKPLPWNTLPEKCVWSNNDSKIIYCAVPKSFAPGDYPDSWYQGLSNFSDDIWMVNTDTMTSTLIFDIEKETSKKIDGVNLQLDKKDNFLFFINKTDLSLWSLSLN